MYFVISALVNKLQFLNWDTKRKFESVKHVMNFIISKCKYHNKRFSHIFAKIGQ